jgi:molecular chaperone GrpE
VPKDAEGTPAQEAPAQPAAQQPPAERVAELEAQLAEARDRALRARADYDNLQRRMAREGALETARAKARVLEGFLPVLELAHMAAAQAEHHPGPLTEGVLLLAREFDRFAQREGLARVGAVGEAVDPSRHDVLAEEEAPGVAPGRVSRVVAPGYVLEGRVLRAAKVCVQPAAPAQPRT